MTDTKTLSTDIQEYLQSATAEDKEVLQQFLNGLKQKHAGNHPSYVSGWLQAEGSWNEDGSYQMRIPIHKGIQNPLEIVHGGVTATLMDTCMGTLANHSTPAQKAAVTLEIKVNYLKPGKGNYLYCRTEVISQSSKTLFLTSSIKDENDHTIAFGTGTFYIIDFLA